MRWMLLLMVVVLASCGGPGAPTITAEDVLGQFKAAGLEAESPTKMTPKDYGVAPLLCQDGARRFLIPSLGTNKGGRLYVCTNQDDATKLKTFYDKAGEGSALLHSWTYQKGSVIVQINGDLDQAKADQYGAVIAALP